MNSRVSDSYKMNVSDLAVLSAAVTLVVAAFAVSGV